MKTQNSDLFTLKNFRLIFEYGNENSGQLMFDRFVHDFNRHEKAFINDLCDIDRAKFDKWVLNRLNHTKKCFACHTIQVGKILTPSNERIPPPKLQKRAISLQART